MPFEKGKSGNPGGKPKIRLEDGRTLADLAREHTADAVSALVDVVKDRRHPQRVAAATAILDRGWGRPRQDIAGAIGVLTGLPSSPGDVSDRLAAIISEISARA